MKKILFICAEASFGLSPFATNIIQAAAKSEHLEVYAVTVDNETISYRTFLKDFPEDQIRFLPAPKNITERIRNKLYVKNILREVKKICRLHEIDIIHLLTVDYTCATILHRLKKNCPVYYTVHDVVPHESVYANLKHYLFSFYIKWGVKHNMRKADCLITNSKHQYNLIKEMYPQKNVYFQLFPPLITDSILTGEKICPEIASIDKYILFFGAIEKYKGIEYLYEAFKNNANLHSRKLVIAGKGTIYFPHDDDSDVIFINRYIHDEEIKSLYTRASCVVYPYISATQSGVLTLAYRFRIPALASDIPYFREVSDEKSCLFFKRADAADLSKKLEQLLFDTDNAEMKTAQKTFYENNYSEQALITSIEQIYLSDNE